MESQNPETLIKNISDIDFFNNKISENNLFLLTIDDGFNNNFEFTKRVLEPLNLKAIFFIIPKFIDSDKKVFFSFKPKLKTISFICGFAFEKPRRNFEQHLVLINSESISF